MRAMRIKSPPTAHPPRRLGGQLGLRQLSSSPRELAGLFISPFEFSAISADHLRLRRWPRKCATGPSPQQSHRPRARGFSASHPSGRPMRRFRDVVRAALDGGDERPTHRCRGRDASSCPRVDRGGVRRGNDCAYWRASETIFPMIFIDPRPPARTRRGRV